jgi:transposase
MKNFFNWKRKRKHSLRRVVDTIFYLTRTGIQWRNLSQTRFPDWRVVYYYFRSWKKAGLLRKINTVLNSIDRMVQQRKPWPTLGLVDSQSILLAPMIGHHRGTDGNKKVNGRKRHILTDSDGRIYCTISHAANLHDSPQGQSLLDILPGVLKHLRVIMGDKTYRGTFARAVARMGMNFESPDRPDGVSGFTVETKRWAVERSFAWLNFFRRVDKDRERTTSSSESFVLLANMTIMLNRISNNVKLNF